MGDFFRPTFGPGGWFGGDDRKPTPPPDPDVQRRKGEEEAKRKGTERRQKLKKYGRQSTFGTSRAGLVGTGATLAKKTLLGQ